MMVLTLYVKIWRYEIFFVSLSRNLKIATIESKNQSNQHENIRFQAKR